MPSCAFGPVAEHRAVRSSLLRRWLVLAVALLALPPCARAQDLPALLAYDAGRPLDLKVERRERVEAVLVEEVRFAGASGAASVAATIVRPTRARAPFAGIVWGHWFEPKARNSNRRQFLDEAIAMARVGVVSILPDTLWTDPQWFDTRSWRNDYSTTLGQARDFRRAIDALLAQGGVDPARIAFVGHDFSAMHGALISAVETRVKAWVLIAGTAHWSDWYLFGAADGVPAGDELDAYQAQLARLDPIAAIATTRASVLFQFGELDVYTPRANFTAFYSAAPAKTTRLATYASQHPMADAVTRIDRDLWLAEQLALPAPWQVLPGRAR